MRGQADRRKAAAAATCAAALGAWCAREISRCARGVPELAGGERTRARIAHWRNGTHACYNETG